MKIHLPGGETAEAELPDGFVMPHEPWTHRVENMGAKDIRATIYEKK